MAVLVVEFLLDHHWITLDVVHAFLNIFTDLFIVPLVGHNFEFSTLKGFLNRCSSSLHPASSTHH